ncbi:MAG: hypothetical protein H6652_27020 [Ardenticatenaceae bacterium]|nr:hypothetical protein [Ardenticatenaceae bacterium]
MSKSKTTNIVRMDWLTNRTPTGKRSATKARKLAQYFALGRGREKEQELRSQRGQWLDQDGRACAHQEVLQWVRQQGMSHELTHQFILSVKETQLTAEAFNRAMAAGGPLFPEWRLIQHEDTRYPHAHALAFGQQEVHIKSEAFQAWWQGVRDALEQEQAAARELQLEQVLEQARAETLQLEAKHEPSQAVKKQQVVTLEQQPQTLEREVVGLEQSGEHLEQLGAELSEDELEQAREQAQSWGLEL